MAQDFAHHQRHDSGLQQTPAPIHSKKLIVCCDGTWMDSDNGYVKGSWGQSGHIQTPSNVTRIARAICSEDDDHNPQIVYYQAGVGTGLGIYSHLVGGGTGLGLSEHIREAYAFLVNNYRNKAKGENGEDLEPGVSPDSIFLIGFSRGAFTARSIGGLIGAVGLLERKTMAWFYNIIKDWENAGNPHYTPTFFDAYFDCHNGNDEVKKFKPDAKLAKDHTKIDHYMAQYFAGLRSLGLTRDVKINCIGVWDTVGSLGIPVNPIFQKLMPFLPSFVREYSWFDTRLSKNVNNAFQALALDEHRYPFSPTLWETDDDTTNLKQVWFPGAHSNVGGAYNDTGMADITLAWMMDQLSGNTISKGETFKPKEWIKFDPDYLQFLKTSDLMAVKKASDPYGGWAMGYVYESLYFPMSVLGRKVRGPGCYRKTDFQTGKPTKELLKGTNEFIHSSVRARLDMAGRCVEPDWDQIFPKSLNILPLITRFFRWITGRRQKSYLPQSKGQPLYGWELKDGHKSHSHANMDIDMSPDGLPDITWEYKGKELTSSTVLKEDKMGPFELDLLKRDQKLASQIMFSNNCWHWRKRYDQKPSLRNASTF